MQKFTKREHRRKDIYKKNRPAGRLEIVGALLLITVAGLVIALSALSFHPDLRVESIRVEGTKSIDPLRLERAAFDTLEGRYLSLFSRANALLVSEHALVQSLMKESSRVESVSVHKETTRDIVLTVVERDPIALWCGELPNDNAREDCSYIDDTAIIFDEAPEFSSHVFVKIFGKPDLSSGLRKIDYDRFIFLKGLAELLEKDHFMIEEAWIKDEDDYVLLVDDSSRREWTLRVRDEYVPAMIVNDLHTILGEIETNEPHAVIDYIDMRFGERVYYKTH